MGRLMTLYVSRTLDYLAQEGKRIITEAKRTKETQNDSYNQYDAYGYLVYYNGVLKKWSISPELADEPHRGWKKYGIPDATGTQWADMFKADFEPPKSGFALVVFNAAFYSLIQEEGAGRLTHQYQILSQVVGSLQDIKNKFKNSTLSGINITIG